MSNELIVVVAAPTGEVYLQLPACEGGVQCSASLSSFQFLVASPTGEIVLWDISRKSGVRLLDEHLPVHSISVSRDRSMLLLGEAGTCAKVFDMRAASSVADRPTLEMRGHDSTSVRCVCLSSCGRLIASGGGDGTISISRTDDSKLLAFFASSSSGAVLGLSFNEGATLLAAAASDDVARVYRVELTEHATLPGLVLAHVDPASAAVLAGHTASVMAVAFSPSGTQLATGSEDATIQVWTVATRACLGRLVGHTDSVVALRFSRALLLSASRDGSARLWDMRLLRSRTVMRDPANPNAPLLGCDWSPCSALIATVASSAVVLWDLEGRALRTLELERAVVTVFSPAGRYLATCARGEDILVHDAFTGDLEYTQVRKIET